MGPRITEQDVIDALISCKGVRAKAAAKLGTCSQVLQKRINALKAKGIDVPESSYDPGQQSRLRYGEVPRSRPPPEISIPKMPDGKIDIQDLIDRRKKEFKRIDESKRKQKLIPIKVSSNKPIAVCLFGDPHVDDPGTDLSQLQRDMTIVKKTPGMYAGSIGDVQNNWVGRLARLYGDQETTAHQAWQLVEWFVSEMTGKWLFMVQGNHDHWSGSGDPIRWMQRQSKVNLVGDHAVRLALRFPNKQEVRIVARHDFPGNSIWNPSHGQLRAAQLTHHDHVLVSGHKHTGGYQLLRVPSTGLLTHCLQLGSYKIHDSYADQLGLPSRLISPSATVIVDPSANELGLVRVEHDTEAAADWLTWRRSRKQGEGRLGCVYASA